MSLVLSEAPKLRRRKKRRKKEKRKKKLHETEHGNKTKSKFPFVRSTVRGLIALSGGGG